MPKNTLNPVSQKRIPLYRQIAEQIRTSLADKRPGDRLHTEMEYAKKFDASVFTIRQAVNELIQDGLIEKRQGSGTFISAKSPPQKHVAVLLDVDITSENLSPSFIKLAHETRKALRKLGLPSRPYLGELPLGIEPTGLTCQDLLDDIAMDRISGVISSFTRRSPEWTDILRNKNIPVIDPEYFHIDRRNIHREQEFLRAAFEYFIKRGRKHVALLIWESPTDGLYFFSKSFLCLAREYGLHADPHFMDNSANGWEKGMAWERFRDIWRCKKEKPDALIIGDDMLFEDCQKAILELEIEIPKMMDVVVHSSDAVQLNPQFPVFNWQLQIKAIAERRAEEMLALIEGRTTPDYISAPHKVFMHKGNLQDLESCFEDNMLPASAVHPL